MNKPLVTTITPTPSIWKRIFYVCSGAILLAINLRTFVYSAELFPGGFSGLAFLIQRGLEKYCGFTIPYSVLYLTLNAFPVYISFRYIGRKFTIFSLLMIVLSSVLSDLLPAYTVTEDVLLCSVFGGILSGLSTVLCLWGDATSGGTDFIAIYYAGRHGKDMWNFIFGANCIILVIAGILFGWNTALYSIIFQYTFTQVLNLLYRRYQKSTLLIITEKPDDVYKLIYTEANHDATRFEVIGCYKNKQRTMIYTVVSGDQVKRLVSDLRALDPGAFINVLQTKELMGKFFTRPND